MLPLHFVCNNVFCKSSLYYVKTKHRNVDCIEYIAPLGIFTLYLAEWKKKKKTNERFFDGKQIFVTNHTLTSILCMLFH